MTLEPIWEWISRDLMPGEVKAVTGQVAAAFERGEADTCRGACQRFPGPRRDADAMRPSAPQQTDEKVRRRLCSQIGTPRALDDVTAIMTVLKARDTLSAFGSRLPDHIKMFDDTHDKRRQGADRFAGAGGRIVVRL